MDEPSMLAQKPSSSHLQSTSHILRSTFHDLFTQDSVDAETIRNLSASRRGNNDYHDKYVERLLVAHNKWSENIERSRKLVEYLNKACEDARILEQKEHEEKEREFESYTNLGLPPVMSKLKVFIDDSLLKHHNLISPNEILNQGQQIQFASLQNEIIPQYENSTYTSRQMFEKVLPEDCYKPKSPVILPPMSNVTNIKTSREKESLKQFPKGNMSHEDKNVWRSCINPVQRDIEKKDLANLQKKANFLKNPRLIDTPKSFLVKTSTVASDLRSDMEYFKPSPCPVVFNDYKVHMQYQTKLELKNITSSCRQVRILQPSSRHFSVSQGEFPLEDALVAPGMSCTYVVTFIPDTLGDYDDVLIVKTQAREPVLIPLQARRTPPLLSLPKVLNCGFSLVGDKKTVEYMVQNDGGNGRFCFVLGDKDDSNIDWNAENFGESGTIEFLPFMLTPSSFKLDCGESIKLQLTFESTAVRVSNIKIILLCDNCTETAYFVEGRGEMPHVELTYVEDGVLQPCIGEIYDETAGQIIQFGKQYPGVTCKKELHITNTVSVPLQYQWGILLPSVSSKLEENTDVSDSVFSIEPVSGYLSGSTVEKFDVLFTPNESGSFYHVAYLQLQNIPIKQSDDTYVMEDQIAMKLSLKGSTQEYSLSIFPPLVNMSGHYFIGKFYYRTIKVQNPSKVCTHFKWKEINEDSCMISVDPSEDVVEAEDEVDCLLTIKGKEVGQVHKLIEYEIPFSTKKHVLYFQCDFKGPSVTFSESSLTFGLVRFKTSESRHVTIVNSSPIAATWSIVDQNDDISNYRSPYSLYPCEGVIEGESIQEITVHFYPLACKTFSSLFKCTVDYGDACYLPVHAEVLCPNVYLEKCEIVIDEAFLDVPIERKVTLMNSNLLTAVFSWNLLGKYGDDVISVSCEPKTGELRPGEKLDIYIQFSFHELGDVEHFIVCDVEEMLEPVVLSIKAKVDGLNVDITMPDMDDIRNEKEIIRNNDILEFGVNNLIGEAVDAFVIIENMSAIETSFAMSTKEFIPFRVPTPPKIESTRTARGSSSRPLISRMFSATRTPRSEDQERNNYKDIVLQTGKGLAFVCSPSAGKLLPFETKIVTVTAYTDMWGEYQDTLICKIGDVDEKFIPVHIDVIGCPLNFQICKEQPVMVRFGAHISGDKPVIRNLRINNTSHFDIRLDWKTYIVLPNDNKLIDLNLYFGNPFPIYDEDGVECIDDVRIGERLITVVLEEHCGNEVSEPFSIKNTQVIIPGKSGGSIDVCFQPPFGLLEETKYLGYALGYMSLQENDCNKPALYTRLHGIDMIPFSLNMTASVKPARLHLETCDEGGFQFTLSASDLLDKGSVKETIFCDRRFVVSNNCGTTVLFLCHIDPPFKIMRIGEERKGGNKKIVLKSHENTEITVRFEINSNLAASIYQNDNQQIYRELLIEFENKGTQSYSLVGAVDYPSIVVSENIIDLGICFVGGRKERVFRISNPSKELLCWNIEKDLRCPETSRSVFSFSSDTLDGNIAGSAGSDIKVYFSPKHNVEYECVLLVSSLFRKLCLKEESIEVVLRGTGSYDEATRGHSDNL